MQWVGLFMAYGRSIKEKVQDTIWITNYRYTTVPYNTGDTSKAVKETHNFVPAFKFYSSIIVIQVLLWNVIQQVEEYG